MKKGILILSGLMFSLVLVSAQQNIKVSITVTEDGKVTTEKSYESTDSKSIKTALKVFEMIVEGDGNTEVIIKKKSKVDCNAESAVEVKKEKIEKDVEQEKPDKTRKKKVKKER